MTHLLQLRFTEKQMVDMLSANGYDVFKMNQQVTWTDPTSNVECFDFRKVYQLMKNGKNILPTDIHCFISWQNCITEEFTKLVLTKILAL